MSLSSEAGAISFSAFCASILTEIHFSLCPKGPVKTSSSLPLQNKISQRRTFHVSILKVYLPAEPSLTLLERVKGQNQTVHQLEEESL